MLLIIKLMTHLVYQQGTLQMKFTLKNTRLSTRYIADEVYLEKYINTSTMSSEN